MITRIKLTNFRQFQNKEFNLDNNFVIIHANNTRGKSTILEAIHIIANQSSPFTSSQNDLYNYDEDAEHYRIEVSFTDTEGESRELAYFQDDKQKQFFRNNSKTTKKKFSEDIAATMFSPEQIETLMLSSQKRRDYINGLISKIDLDYVDQLGILNKTLRQRNAYLKRLAKRFYESGNIDLEDKQLLYWSEAFSKASAVIMRKRAAFIQLLKNGTFSLEYVPSFDVAEYSEESTLAEEDRTNIQEMDFETLESAHLQALVRHLRRDVAHGYSTIGAHRDDWKIHAGKDIKKFGSRGEKRMAIGRMIFRNQEILAQELGFYPILLLDDISSELDIINTEKILRDSLQEGQQVIVTAISLDGFPEDLVERALVINP